MVLRCIPSMRGSGWLSASRILPCFLSREKQTVFDFCLVFFCMLECSGSKEKRDHAHLCATTTKTWFWTQGFFFCFDHQYVIHYCHCIHSVCTHSLVNCWSFAQKQHQRVCWSWWMWRTLLWLMWKVTYRYVYLEDWQSVLPWKLLYSLACSVLFLHYFLPSLQWNTSCLDCTCVEAALLSLSYSLVVLVTFNGLLLGFKHVQAA